MSKYTTEIRFLCEHFAGLENNGSYVDIDSAIAAAIPNIFSFDFPIWDENYRDVLCTKILRHYYTREIGEEVYGLWKLRLEAKLNEIMPYYNKLYESGIKDFNPLWTSDMQTSYDKTIAESRQEDETGSSKNSSDDTTNNRETKQTTRDRGVEENKDKTENGTKQDIVTSEVSADHETSSQNKDVTIDTGTKSTTDKYSDTPQGGLNGVLNTDYLTNARIVDDSTDKSSTVDGTASATGTDTTKTDYNDTITETKTDNEVRKETEKENEDTTIGGLTNRYITGSESKTNNKNSKLNSTEGYVLKMVGRTGDPTKAMEALQLKSTLMNIDVAIINDLEVLFMNVW